MKEPDVQELLGEVQAVITDSHLVYKSGLHGSVYVNKDAVYPHIISISLLCRAIAKRFASDNVDVVIGPALGGIILSQWTAHHLSVITFRNVMAVYAEKNGENFVIKRSYDKLIADKRVLVVEDILTTGGSARKVVEAVRQHGGQVIGLGVLCNRGSVTSEAVGNPPRLEALLNLTLETYEPANCPLCAQGVPINTDVGHGREFLAKQQKS